MTQLSRSTNPTAYAHQIAGTFLFFGIAEDEISALVSSEGVRVGHFEKDAVIFDRMQIERALGVILFGSCVVTKESETGKMPMSVLRQGDLFGAASLFHHEAQYVARVTAAESAWILLISEEALKGMMRKDFRIVENYLSYLTARIRFLSERLDGFLPQSVEERVMQYVTQRAENGLFESEWSVSALAESLRVSRTTLYRAIDKLIAEGRIAKQGRTFQLIQTAIANEPPFDRV
ncbi:MAG: Crp/Fnr family transcriptional regulator [Clostridiaceae bacterium]